MKRFKNPEKTLWSDILARPVLESRDLDSLIGDIKDQIYLHGDEALKAYTSKFDGVDIADICVDKAELEQLSELVPDELKVALSKAKENIYKFHAAQYQPEEEKIETTPGVYCWRKSTAIPRVGLYIPGGSAPLFSTVLMLAIPATIAGCTEIVICTPPQKDGTIHPSVAYAAQLCGVQSIYKVGGAQSILAMASGKTTIPKVDKILGPGNQYVTAAKMAALSMGCSIDMPAGPSEVMVVADDSAIPAFVASDLLAQAEHGPDSHTVLIASTEAVADAVEKEVRRQKELLPRVNIINKSSEQSIIVTDIPESLLPDIINEYAPEHLILSTRNDESILDQVHNAGSIFLGNYTPESLGDYASGTNHTLPTNGYARAFSGVSVDSFLKKITVQRSSASGLKALSETVITMAKAENLDAHAASVSIRLKEIENVK